MTRDAADQFSFAELLYSAAARMNQDLSERLISHPGEKGAGREEVVRKFLRSYLPKRFEIGTGFAFDYSGQLSRQLDVVVVDAFSCPLLETTGGIRLFPCESVVAVGQIRSQITSRKQLDSALENLNSVKELDRSAGGAAFDRIRREPIRHKENHLHQIFTFILVTGRALSADTAFRGFAKYIAHRETHVWPNVLVALTGYLITYACDDGICPNAMHAHGIATRESEDPSELLMRFYLLLARAVEVTGSSGLAHADYLEQLRTWEANVFSPMTVSSPLFSDSAPPHLRDLLELLEDSDP